MRAPVTHTIRCPSAMGLVALSGGRDSVPPPCSHPVPPLPRCPAPCLASGRGRPVPAPPQTPGRNTALHRETPARHYPDCRDGALPRTASRIPPRRPPRPGGPDWPCPSSSGLAPAPPSSTGAGTAGSRGQRAPRRRPRGAGEGPADPCSPSAAPADAPLARQPGPPVPLQVVDRSRAGAPSDAGPVPAGPCRTRPATGTRTDAPSDVSPGPGGRGPSPPDVVPAPPVPLRRPGRFPALHV